MAVAISIVAAVPAPEKRRRAFPAMHYETFAVSSRCIHHLRPHRLRALTSAGADGSRRVVTNRAAIERARPTARACRTPRRCGIHDRHDRASCAGGRDVQLVPTRSASTSVQTLAERIINAQEDEIGSMQQLAVDRRQPVPDPADAHAWRHGHDMGVMPTDGRVRHDAPRER